MATFPEFGTVSEVPDYGVTVGIATIADHARRTLMLVHGAAKRQALARLTRADAYDPSWAATVVVESAAADIYADTAATTGIPGSSMASPPDAE